MVLISILLMNIVFVVSVKAEETQLVYYNVTVESAYDMINDLDVVVLDVRYECEYDMGHLFGAVLIPYDELETRINELSIDSEIIVYCKSGYRSVIASEILVEHGFGKVYNMLGGILAWIDADYPIYTTFHHVTANVIDGAVLLEIEPLLLLQTGAPPCAQNQTNCTSCAQTQNQSQLENVEFTVLEENATYTLTLVSYEVNGSIFEVTVANILLWSYSEVTDEINRTASFISTEITMEEVSTQLYSLRYLVQHAGNNLGLYTRLVPLDSETYNASFTVMNYVSAGKLGSISLELVEFNSSVTLSQQYGILGKVAKETGKVYEKSGDETLEQLAPGYYTMMAEAKYLSKLVEHQLEEYDREILRTVGVVMDPECWEDNHCSWMGPGYCCVDGHCEPCEPPPPPPPFPWLCNLICGTACLLGCELGWVIICLAACATPCAVCVGMPTPWNCGPCFWCVISCEVIAFAVCALIGTYGCSPGCGWLCGQL